MVRAIEELNELGVPIKVVNVEEGQTETEAVTEETENEKKEIYVVVMEQGEKVPDEGTLNGYSVNNPYGGESGGSVEKKDEDKEAVSSATRLVNKTMEESDLPPPKEVAVPDPTAILDVTVVVQPLAASTRSYDMKYEELSSFEMCTIAGGKDTGYRKIDIQNGIHTSNNYSMFVREDSMRSKGGTKLDIYEDTLALALSEAHKERPQYIAPGKREVTRRQDTQPILVADTELVNWVIGMRDDYADPNKYIEGKSREQRAQDILALDDLLLDLTNKKDDDGPFRYGQGIPNRTFDIACDKRILDVKIAVAEIDKERMVAWDYYDPLYKALETTSRVLEKPDKDLVLQRDQYYEVECKVHLPDESSELLTHPRNAALMQAVVVPQVKRAAFNAQLALANVSAATNDLALALNMQSMSVTNDGKIAQMADPNGASDLLHNFLACMMHKSMWFTYPLSCTPLMQSEFDLAMLMDCVFYPMLMNPLVIGHSNVRAMRNYLYYFLFRPALGITTVLTDDDSAIDLLARLFDDPNVIGRNIDGVTLRFLRTASQFYGKVDMAEVERDAPDLDVMPPGYNNILIGENGRIRETVVKPELEEYIVRPVSNLTYARERVGKAACTSLNGAEATLGRKPVVGIWDSATRFARAFNDLCALPQFKSQLGSVDPRTLTSIAKTLARVTETRMQGFQHRINEMNYFLEYTGNYSYAEPKTVQDALRYNFLDGNPTYAEIRPGSIYSAIALTPISDFIDIKVPNASDLIDGLKVYEDISEFLCTKRIMEEFYEPESMQAAIGYDRPIKLSTNTSKRLLMRSFEAYGTKSPTVNAIRTEVERIGYDDFENWYWPEISAEQAMEFPLFRKFSLWYNLLKEMEFERGLMPGFHLTRYDADTDLVPENTNGGLTRPTKYKRLRQVTSVKPDMRVDERLDEESFFRQYVQSDNYNDFFNMVQDVRKGRKSIYFDIPVLYSLIEMSPEGGGLNASSFPLTFNSDTAASVAAKPVTVEYWRAYDQTGEDAFDQKYTYREDKFSLIDNPLILTHNGDFLREIDLVLSDTHKFTTKVTLPERGLKLRPERKYYNPLLYTPH